MNLYEQWGSLEESVQIGPNPNAASLASGYYRYSRQMLREQAEITGSTEEYLTADEEWELGNVIGSAKFVESQITALEKTDPHRAAQERQTYAQLLASSKSAQHKLVLANLRFAAYYARASMNFITPGQAARDRATLETDNGTDLPGNRKGRVGAYSDITLLRSQYADLDDRVQVANEALLKAAAEFEPTIRNNRRTRFTTFAAWRIHSALSRYAAVQEKPGWRITDEVAATINKASKYPNEFTVEKRAQLEQYHAGRFTVALHEVELPVDIPEEDDAWHPAPKPTLADIIPDQRTIPVEQEVMDAAFEDTLGLVLQHLTEREAGVLRLRFGLVEGGEARTLQEIGDIYGVTVERVRQIEKKALSKAADTIHTWRRAGMDLTGYMENGNEPPFLNRSVNTGSNSLVNIKTGRIIVGQATSPEAEALTGENDRSTALASSPRRESWQAYEGESWDDPVRISEEELLQQYEQVAATFASLLATMPTYAFQRSFAQNTGTAYPVEATRYIQEVIGSSLTASHIEEYWNSSIESFVNHLHTLHGADVDITRVSTLFSRLLAEYMSDDDTVELTIPRSLDKQLHYLGSGITNGKLTIHGNAGDFVGHKAKGLAHIVVRGSAGDYAAYGLQGYARVDVVGTVGDHFGKACGKNTTATNQVD